MLSFLIGGELELWKGYNRIKNATEKSSFVKKPKRPV